MYVVTIAQNFILIVVIDACQCYEYL